MPNTAQFVTGAIFVLLAIAAIVFIQFKSKQWKTLFGEHQAWYVKTALTILVLFALLFAMLMAFLDPSNREHLLTIFGIVASIGIALASTPFLSNAMAGLMLITSGTFRPGDYIEIGDHFGRVTKRRLFHLIIQTVDRDMLTLPNLHVVSTPHKVIKKDGTIIGCVVSLGYDVSHQQVEDAMLTAALAAQLEDPFVQVQKLGDYSVEYRVAGLLTDVRYLISERSNLRRLVIDSLHSAGVEIVSPTFMNQRQISDEKVMSEVEKKKAVSRQKSRPEDLIFDEAEQVARLERLNDKLQKLQSELSELKDQKLSPEANPHTHQMRIMRKERNLKILEQIIENKSKEIDT